MPAPLRVTPIIFASTHLYNCTVQLKSKLPHSWETQIVLHNDTRISTVNHKDAEIKSKLKAEAHPNL